MTANEWCELLIKLGPQLRDAGVLSLQIDGMAATFTAAVPRIADGVDAGQLEDPGADPLHNPALYPGGVVPGYQLETEDER